MSIPVDFELRKEAMCDGVFVVLCGCRVKIISLRNNGVFMNDVLGCDSILPECVCVCVSFLLRRFLFSAPHFDWGEFLFSLFLNTSLILTYEGLT